MGRQRLQGQGADRRRGRGRHPRRHRGRASRRTAGSAIERRPFADAEAAGLVERFDPYEGYERFVRRTVDLDALEAADVSILVDPMWGAGSGWISRLLAGGRIRVDRDPPGAQPVLRRRQPRADPARTSTRRSAILAGGGYDLGLLLDGDADRAGAADERGTFIHQLQVTGLLMYYLAEHRGLREPVVVSVNNTSMAARLGEHYGIETYETPVGFKFIGPKMIETGAMMGAEESGGFGFGMHLPERDGVYADLLLLDLFLRERAAGRWPVSRAIEHFHEIAGPSWYRRIDVHVERAAYPETKRRLLVDLARPGAGRAGRASRSSGRSRSTPTTASSSGSPTARGCSSGRPGTEPLVRVYTEATSEAIARRAAGRRRAAGPRRMSGEDGAGTAGRQAVGPRADLGPHGPVRRQGPGHRGRQAAVAPAPRGQGRIDPGDGRPAAAVPRGRRRHGPGRGARAGRPPARADRPDPPLRGDRADAS